MAKGSAAGSIVSAFGNFFSGAATKVKDTATTIYNKVTGKTSSTPKVDTGSTPAKTDPGRRTNSTKDTDDVIEQSNETAGSVKSGGSGGSKSSGGSGSTNTGTKKGKDNDDDVDKDNPLKPAEDTSTLGTTTLKSASPLKTAAKVAAGGTAAAGVGYLIATGAQSPTPNPSNGGGGGGDTPYNPGGEGQPTYVYTTGYAPVDEALNWLQLQVDEIVYFLNDLMSSLFGGEGTSGGDSGMAGAWDFADYDGSGGTSSSRKIPTLIIVLAVAAVLVVVAKKKNGKKTGKKGRK